MDPHRQSLIPVFLTQQLERTANRTLMYAPVTRMQLVKLKGRTLALELEKPHFPLYLAVGKRQLRFQSRWDAPADVTIRGPALSLLRQMSHQDNTPADLMKLGIEIDGDQQLAQQFLVILRDLDMDFESLLGDVVGDVAAHQISTVARVGLSWFRSTAKTVLQQSRHLLVEEQEWLISPQLFRRFRSDVEELREDSDRLQARLTRFQSRLQSRNENPLNQDKADS